MSREGGVSEIDALVETLRIWVNLGPTGVRREDGSSIRQPEAHAALTQLADFARLCAELGEALTHVLAEYDAGEVTDASEAVAYDALASLAELEAR